MLATLVAEPFHEPGWVYEEKYDGYRVLAYKEGKRVTLLSRNGNDKTAAFDGIARAVAALPARTLLLDGEAISVDQGGVSRFQALQSGNEPVLAAFDCLYANGQDLRELPLSSRRSHLESVLAGTSGIFASRRLAENGLEAFEQATAARLEGLIAKDLAAPYIQGRSKKWLKVKVQQQDEFVIGGFTAPAGSRTYLGALLLGAYDQQEKLRYVGKVGTGFKAATLESLHKALRKLTREKPPFTGAPRERDVTYVAPKLVGQIAYQEWTEDRKLRHPVFLGLRDDKRPEECLLPSGART